jgi:hypothetical protein
MIDMASVFADRYKKTPKVLSDAVMGQSIDPSLDPYTALNALKLVNESQRMAMAGQAQQPTSSPSIVAQNVAPPMQQGLGAMVPGAMGGQGMPPQGMPPQGMPPQGMPPQGMPQQTMQAASGGLAGMYSPDEDYAAGGIVAFAEPTEDNNYSLVRDESAPDYVFSESGPSQMRVLESEAVDRDLYDDTDGTETGFLAAQKLANRRIASLGKIERKKFDRAGFIKDYMNQIKKEGGVNIYDEELARGPQDEADRIRARQVGEANAYFTAAGKVLKGSRLSEGASEALPAFGSAMSEVEKLDQAAKQANSKMQFALKDAKRKERLGDYRGAAAAAELARKYEQDENKFEFDKARYGADVAVRNVAANRPLRSASGSGDASTKLPQVDRDAANIAKQIVDLQNSNPDDPKLPALKQKLVALEKIIAATKTSEAGPGKLGAQETQIFVGAAKEATSSARKRGNQDAAYLAALRNRDTVAANNRMKEIYAEEIQKFFPSTPLSDLLSAAPPGDLTPASGGASTPAASKPAASTARVMSMADVQATAAASGKTTQEVIDAAKAKGYTIK